MKNNEKGGRIVLLVKERVMIEDEYDVQPKQAVTTPPLRKKKIVRKSTPNHVLRKMAVSFIGIFIASTLVITLSSRVDSAGYELVKDKEVLTELQKENEQLHLELARLKSPERIQRIAKNDLKMRVPESTCYPTSRRIAAPTPPKPMQKTTSTENIVGMIEGFVKQIIS